MQTSAKLCALTVLWIVPLMAWGDDANMQGSTVLPKTARCGEKYITTYEITKCVSEVLNQLNPILNRVVDATRKHMQTRIAEETEPRYVNELRHAAASFEKAQAAWERYREFQCDARASEFLNGTGREAGYVGCIADITSARILELWSATGLPAPM